MNTAQRNGSFAVGAEKLTQWITSIRISKDRVNEKRLDGPDYMGAFQSAHISTSVHQSLIVALLPINNEGGDQLFFWQINQSTNQVEKEDLINSTQQQRNLLARELTQKNEMLGKLKSRESALASRLSDFAPENSSSLSYKCRRRRSKVTPKELRKACTYGNATWTSLGTFCIPARARACASALASRS